MPENGDIKQGGPPVGAGGKYPALEERHRLFICDHLARMIRPVDTARALLEKFAAEWGEAGRTIDGTEAAGWREWSIRQVDYTGNHPNASQWQAIIQEKREAWLASIGSSVRERHKTARIEEYSEVYRRAMEAKDFAAASRALHSIAEEVNELPTRDGQVNVVISQQLSVDQRKALVTVEQLGETDRDRLLQHILDREEIDAGAEEGAGAGQPAALPAGAVEIR